MGTKQARPEFLPKKATMRRLKSAQIPTIRALSNSDWDMDLASSTSVVKIKLGEILEFIFYFFA
jgi:hypothetical protein